jgi:drug/metabolite transporter (DMT)-like permease
MPVSALVLVLVAALLHAVWNIAAKTAATRGADHRFAFLTAIATVLLWLPAAAFVAPRELPTWGQAQWLALLASAGVHVVYYQTLLRGYREADLTVVYPVARGSAPLATAAAAVLILGETIHALGVAGVLGICGGVFLVAGGPAMLRSLRGAAPHGGGEAAPAEAARQRQRLRAGLAWGGATGALIALYSVIDGYAIKVLAMGPLLFDWMCNVLRLPLQAPMVWRERATLPGLWRVHWRQALVVSALGPLAYILVLTALQQAPLSHVAPMREVSLLFAALIGGHLLGERDRGQRLAGAGLIALGVLLLAFGAPGH